MTDTQEFIPIKSNKIKQIFAIYFPHISIPYIRITDKENFFSGKITFCGYSVCVNDSIDKDELCFCIEEQYYKFLLKLVKTISKKYNNLFEIYPEDSINYFKRDYRSIDTDNSNLKSNVEDLYVKEPINDEKLSIKMMNIDMDQDFNREIDGDTYYDKVSNFCYNNREPFPEYMIEKQNGVYICKINFRRQVFTSKYFVEKRDAREDGCRHVFMYISNDKSAKIVSEPVETEKIDTAKKVKLNADQQKFFNKKNDENEFFAGKKNGLKGFKIDQFSSDKLINKKVNSNNFFEMKRKNSTWQFRKNNEKHNMNDDIKNGDIMKDKKKLTFEDLFKDL